MASSLSFDGLSLQKNLFVIRVFKFGGASVKDAAGGGAGPGDVGAGHCLAAGQSAEVTGGERGTMLM